jgi:hypothetical protein
MSARSFINDLSMSFYLSSTSEMIGEEFWTITSLSIEMVFGGFMVWTYASVWVKKSLLGLGFIGTLEMKYY